MTSVYSQMLIFTAQLTVASRKEQNCTIFETAGREFDHWFLLLRVLCCSAFKMISLRSFFPVILLLHLLVTINIAFFPPRPIPLSQYLLFPIMVFPRFVCSSFAECIHSVHQLFFPTAESTYLTSLLEFSWSPSPSPSSIILYHCPVLLPWVAATLIPVANLNDLQLNSDSG